MALTDPLRKFEIPSHVTVMEGIGTLPMLELSTPWSIAEVYLHGAHVTGFQKRDESPLLFVSHVSRFETGSPIRGGIPVILPWFGARENRPMHGFARTRPWTLLGTALLPDKRVRLELELPPDPTGDFAQLEVRYRITVGAQLHLALELLNRSERRMELEDCLHTYFQVGDVKRIHVRGLKGVTYLDKVDNFSRKVETEDTITVQGEVDRVYLNTPDTVLIEDSALGRCISVSKKGANSTVVWNPWIAKAAQLPDFGDDEYLEMVCVESGNVSDDRLSLAPGETSVMEVELSSTPLRR